MTDITPLGSGARAYPVPSQLSSLVDPAAVPDLAPTDAAPATEPSTDTASFDVTQFETAFQALKQQVASRRARVATKVGAAQQEHDALVAQQADWTARIQAASARLDELNDEIQPLLASFAELDQATSHLEATEALLYPQAPAADSAAPAADAPKA